MSFISGPIKQVQEVIFSRKSAKAVDSKIFLSNVLVTKTDSENYLGLQLDSQLPFEVHIRMILNKFNKAKVCKKNLKKCYPDYL